MPNFLVVAELQDGVVHDVSLQALALAGKLAAGGKVSAVVIGSGTAAAAAALAAGGAQEVHQADDARLAAYTTTPYRKLIAGLLAGQSGTVVLLPASTAGNDLAAALAASLDAACVLDSDAVVADGAGVKARRTEFDRKVHTWYKAAGPQCLVITLKDGVAEPVTAAAAGAIIPLAVNLAEADLRARVVKRDVARKSVNLKAAKVIVGAGAGIGNKDNFAKIQELATALNAQIGATRAVVDAGWLPADHQIGQTGATVRPDVYIACGISGAVQHWVGMMDSRKIVAINTDKNAPLMKRAHYRVAGDLNAVIPKLVKILKA
jgi:electron transfer flavoprotein alpha subunit